MNKLKKILKEKLKEVIKYKKIRNYKNYQKQCLKRNQLENIVFCTPLHGNIGDHAIILAIKKFMVNLGINIFEFSTYDENLYFDYILKNISEKANIYITGGGFMGSKWFNEEQFIRKIIKSFPNNNIVIFPQTIFYENNSNAQKELINSILIYNNHKNLYIFAREKYSYLFIKKTYPKVNVKLAPDMVLYDNGIKERKKRKKNILFCVRKDSEKNIDDKILNNLKKILCENKYKVMYTDTVIKKRISIFKRKKIVMKKLEKFNKSKLVITDRLHGMIFAYITKTPCIALANYNYKIKGVYNQWLKDINYIKYIDDNTKITKELIKMLNNNYCIENNKKFDYNELVDIIKQLNRQ